MPKFMNSSAGWFVAGGGAPAAPRHVSTGNCMVPWCGPLHSVKGSEVCALGLHRVRKGIQGLDNEGPVLRAPCSCPKKVVISVFDLIYIFYFYFFTLSFGDEGLRLVG